MQNRLRDKVVIVTGATSGIGLETARLFAERGAKVIPAARRSDPPCDVTRDADVEQLVARTLAAHGRIDILINNAGIGMRAAVADSRPEDVRYLMEVNFFGALRCIQAVLPVMRRQRAGQIVNVGSVLSLIATPYNSIYSASKFALRALTDALRIEAARDNIDVILIMPGYTDTPFFENMTRYGGPPRPTSWKGQHPRRVAAAIARACERRQRDVVLTLPARLGAVVKRLSPRFLDWCLARTIPRG
jgi:short-subunit dehydrogenase